MTIRLATANPGQYTSQIRELFWEYLQWANGRVNEEFHVSFDIAGMLEEDMQTLDKFMPPRGCLLLGYIGNHPAGIACLKELTPSIGEIKRMYVRPESRKQGLGRALMDRLIQEARQIGYRRLRLDSAQFMKEAHQLYKSVGFREIEAYEGSEIPLEFQGHWIFMESLISQQNGQETGL
jgi:GNAT superfamily N-acetyltransferase